MRRSDRQQVIWMAGGAVAGVVVGWLAFDALIGRAVVAIGGCALGWLIHSVMWGAHKPR